MAWKIYEKQPISTMGNTTFSVHKAMRMTATTRLAEMVLVSSLQSLHQSSIALWQRKLNSNCYCFSQPDGIISFSHRVTYCSGDNSCLPNLVPG